MILLFEGVDKTGKTTIAKLLEERTGFEYHKHSTMHSAIDALMAASKVLETISARKTYIFDRFYFPSDLIYGPVVGGYEPSRFVRRMYEDCITPVLMEHGVIFVHCTASDEVLAERFIRDQEEYATVPQIQEIARRYQEFTKYGPFRNVITLDSTDTPTEDLYGQLIDKLVLWGVVQR